MKRSLLAVLGVVVLAVAIAARLHNAWVSPVLAGYDAFGHFTYIWFVAETGRVPLPTQGWSFFHPPLYYALMAALWNALPAYDPVLRLKIGKLVIAALGGVHAAVAWHVVGRCFPGETRARFMAAALMLLVPVQLYSADFLGNEALHAVIGTLSLLALLRVFDRPTCLRGAVLGLCLGLGLLAKYSAVAVAAAALVAIAVRALARRQIVTGLRALVITTAVMLLVCGPYYARNIEAYGTPFQLSRETFMVTYLESNEPQAARGWADYLTFDPLIFRRPMWPRTSTPDGVEAPHGFERSVRESVWTGLFANAWFDGFGGFVLPLVTESDGARRAGQALLALGLVPTALMLLGAWSAIAGMRRRGWDDTTGALALVSAAMLALFAYGTHEAPISAAVKATYFTPISVAFGFWFAHGLVRLQQLRPRWTPMVNVACAALATLSLAVFWQGLLFDTGQLGMTMPRFAEARTTQYGIIEYAGGRVPEARRAFEQASASNYHLAWENLGYLAIGDGRPRDGLKLLHRAARVQREQLDGGPIGRDRFLALAEAEVHHSMAVVLHGIGHDRRADRLWLRALGDDPQHAEALYCLTLSRLERALGAAADAAARGAALDQAARDLAIVRTIDAGLSEGWVLAATVESMRGDCDAARRTLESRRGLPWWTERNYPVETGTGASFSASIGRRRLITPRLSVVDPDQALHRCGLEQG